MPSTTVILLSKIVTYSSNLSAIPAAVTGARKKGLLWLYVLSSLVFDINSFVLKSMGIKFMWASSLFFLVEFILLSIFFAKTLLQKQAIKYAQIAIALLAVYFIVHTIYTVGTEKVNYIDTSIFYALYILMSTIGLYKLLQTAGVVPIEKSHLFFFYVAILIYASGSFIILLYENELLETDRKFIVYAWVFIRNPLNIFKNLLIYYALRLSEKRIK